MGQQALSEKDMAAITARHDSKAQLLREMRLDRAAQYMDQHSHVGVDIARTLQVPKLRQQIYTGLAALANRCAEAQQDNAGRILASLARGLERGTQEMWGPEAVKALRESAADISQLGLPTTPPAPQTFTRLDGKTTITVDTTPGESALVQGVAQPEAEGLAPPPATEDNDLDLTIGGMLPGEPDDVTPSTEIQLSPEPDETPLAKAARLRREQRKGLKSTKPQG